MNVAALSDMGASSGDAGMRTQLKRGTLNPDVGQANPVLAKADRERLWASVETIHCASSGLSLAEDEEKVRASGKPENSLHRHHDWD